MKRFDTVIIVRAPFLAERLLDSRTPVCHIVFINHRNDFIEIGNDETNGNKKRIYQKMTNMNTSFFNWLLIYENLKTATFKVYKLFSDEKMPSAVLNQTIREVKSQKKKQKSHIFRQFWCGFNNHIVTIKKENGLYTLSSPVLGK